MRRLQEFLEEYKASVDFINNNMDEASAIIAEQEIVPSAQIAKAAIPNCNITLITGEQMKSIAQQNLSVLFKADPKSVGGAIPDGNFYYTA
jgi:NitT/TauT family transport system substrate-binding protein